MIYTHPSNNVENNKPHEINPVCVNSSPHKITPECIKKFCNLCKTEIKEEQEICFDCFKRINNLREIEKNEIVLECDDRINGDEILRQIGLLFSVEGYCLEVWRVEGGKSFHIHIKNIPQISELSNEENKLYKELLIKKYIQILKNILGYIPTGLDKLDFSLCNNNHLIAEENKLHFKYKKPKLLIDIVNRGENNFCDKEIYELVKQNKQEYKPTIKGSGITAQIIQKISIIDIAKQFGLSVYKNKTLCPFHPDNNTPSLVFYEQQGRFYCFGCQANGNIIKFYAMLKKLNPNFRYTKTKEVIQSI